MVPLILLGAAFCLAWAYSLGRICLRWLPVPGEVALAVGAAAESSIVFSLLCAGFGWTSVYLGVGALSILLAWFLRGLPIKEIPAAEPAPPAMRLVFGGVLALFGVLYFVHALAPEIESDAITYHLGLAAEYARTGAFPDRIGFFEMVPQGMELLFTVAFAIGRHSAAKLVHFGMLLASVPLIIRIGRRLRLSEAGAMAAAGIYFCTPVTGISGTCAYNDAALVFFVLTVFYLLLVWHERHDDRYLVPAGIAAGFCYAIKFTGIIVLPLAALAVLIAARRVRPVLLLAVGLVLILPWMLRDAILAGNPVAPLFNHWFPNPYFHASTEDYLANTLRSYGVPRRQIFWELAVGGKLQGLYGPLLFLLPAALLALRTRAGRRCWLAAGAMAVPWFFNVGARFLLPTFVFVLLAWMIALPRAALAFLALQAVTCWPGAIGLYNRTSIWRLHGFPWQAALRIQSEDSYLDEKVERYRITRMIQQKTAPGEKILALTPVATAYTDRESLEYWHSAEAEWMLDWMWSAGVFGQTPLYDVRADWPAQSLRALRFRLNQAHEGEWCLHEVDLYDGEDRIRSSPRWALAGWPNLSEMTAAFDDNLASRWRTRIPMRPGMFAEVDLDKPRSLTGAMLVSHTPIYGVPMAFYGMDAAGEWHSFGIGKATQRVWEDLRRPAMRAIRRQGFHYLLATIGDEGTGAFGTGLAGHEAEWGLDRVAESNGFYLFRIQ